MDERLEKFMKDHLGVTVAEVDRMNEKELDDLYEKAQGVEIVLADEAEETEQGEMQDSIDAAHIVDWLWEKVKLEN